MNSIQKAFATLNYIASNITYDDGDLASGVHLFSTSHAVSAYDEKNEIEAYAKAHSHNLTTLLKIYEHFETTANSKNPYSVVFFSAGSCYSETIILYILFVILKRPIHSVVISDMFIKQLSNEIQETIKHVCEKVLFLRDSQESKTPTEIEFENILSARLQVENDFMIPKFLIETEIVEETNDQKYKGINCELYPIAVHLTWILVYKETPNKKILFRETWEERKAALLELQKVIWNYGLHIGKGSPARKFTENLQNSINDCTKEIKKYSNISGGSAEDVRKNIGELCVMFVICFVIVGIFLLLLLPNWNIKTLVLIDFGISTLFILAFVLRLYL